MFTVGLCWLSGGTVIRSLDLLICTKNQGRFDELYGCLNAANVVFFGCMVQMCVSLFVLEYNLC